jgi:hypothetical protein
MTRSKETDNTVREKSKLLPSDFYIENGFKVMTEEYHIKRGYCCGNGCRHCPFTPKSIKGNMTLIEK